MYLYRIANCRYIRDLTGTGGLYAAGRWHNKGTRILYFSEHISLAKLEVLVNTSFIPKGVCLLTVTVPEEIQIEEIDIAKLPNDWDAYPYVEDLKRFTSEWVTSQKSAILKVPSAQSPHEFNYLVNPLHTDINKLAIESVEVIKFDQRLQL